MDVDSRANAVGRGQHGLATRQQLRAVGIAGSTIRRRVLAGRWNEPVPTVIDLRTHPPTWGQAAWRLLLASGPDAVLSHRTAAHLHGFVDCPRPDRIDVLVPRGRHDEVAGSVRLHTTVRLDPDERAEVAGFPCTSEARTWMDVAAFLDDEHLELVSYDLARRRRRIRNDVRVLLDRRKGAPGRARLLSVLEAMPLGVERADSSFEVDVVARLVGAGIPPPSLQYEVSDDAGEFVHRADGAWPDRKVLLAMDGRLWHDTPLRRARDRAQRDRLSELGWEVVVVRYEDRNGARFEALVTRLRGLLGPDEAAT